MNEIEAYIRALFHKLDSPLDKMYDIWNGGDDWREGPPLTRHELWDEIGMPIPCPICGAENKWTAGGHKKAPVFVCVHEPIDIGWGLIPQVATIRPNQISRYKIIG